MTGQTPSFQTSTVVSTRVSLGRVRRFARRGCNRVEKPSRRSNRSGRARLRERPTPARLRGCVRVAGCSAMDFFKNVSTPRGRRREERGGPAPRLGLRLRNRRTVREDAAGRGRSDDAAGRAPARWGGGPARAAQPSRRATPPTRARRGGRRPLIPEDVWNSLRAAKDRVARAASPPRRPSRARRRRRRDRAPRPRRARGLGGAFRRVGGVRGRCRERVRRGGAQSRLGVSVETGDEDGGDERRRRTRLRSRRRARSIRTWWRRSSAPPRRWRTSARRWRSSARRCFKTRVEYSTRSSTRSTTTTAAKRRRRGS